MCSIWFRSVVLWYQMDGNNLDFCPHASDQRQAGLESWNVAFRPRQGRALLHVLESEKLRKRDGGLGRRER
jgi:hypothetical protein